MMRIAFRIPYDPPLEVFSTRMLQAVDTTFDRMLEQEFYDYFVSDAQPQTAGLPRNLVRRTIKQRIVENRELASKFPKFLLQSDRKKFIRCCYCGIWRSLLKEWKARLIFATGKTPAEQKLPRKFDPWMDVEG